VGPLPLVSHCAQPYESFIYAHHHYELLANPLSSSLDMSLFKIKNAERSHAQGVNQLL
jgi:hypothetical protein